MKLVKLMALTLVLVVGVVSVRGRAAVLGREFVGCPNDIEQPYEFASTSAYIHDFFSREVGPEVRMSRLRAYDTAVKEVVIYWNEKIGVQEKVRLLDFVKYVLEAGVLRSASGNTRSCKRALLQYAVAVLRKERLRDDHFADWHEKQKLKYLRQDLGCAVKGYGEPSREFAETMHDLRVDIREYVEGWVSVSVLVDERLDPEGASMRRRETEKKQKAKVVEPSEGGWCTIS